ncbi:MAG TPA: acetate/propionate family kinase [Isosphaeraceae bacterium]|jgi:acetate kinase|nr:acetate/propionate family kinase [Isosphaeraceae bacterium]
MMPEQDAGKSIAGRPARSCLLTINGGSSSLKFAVFDRADPPARLAAGKVERIGGPGARLVMGEGAREVEAGDQGAAVSLVIDWLKAEGALEAIGGVGHRVVHGGGRYCDPAEVTTAMLDDLRAFRPFDPDHLPGEVALIEAIARLDPTLPQVACFDNAFHRDLPPVAYTLPIPNRLEALGVRKYGFHGLSYQYLMDELARIAGPEAARGRVILAHLGAGASLAAVREGKSIDTTMGFTPAAGLVMATRSGDLDPGLVRFLARSEGMSAEGFDRMVNRESGLLGVSGTSDDVRDLLGRRDDDPRAALAIDLFCYRVKLAIGGHAAALGGLETLVFAGGIGEHSAEVRAGACEGLGFLGVVLDPARNAAGAPVISAEGSRATVRVIPTDEEATLARATARLLNGR